MKNFIFLIVFATAIFGFTGLKASAQVESRLNSSPRAFRTFFSKFLAAARAGDKRTVASMTSFPFEYGFDTEDEGTMSKAQFVKRFGEIFGASPRRFLPEKNPLFSRDEDGSYVVSTEEAANLIFVKSGGTFKFKAIVVEP